MNYWKIPLVCVAGALLAVASCGHPGNGGTGTGTGGSTGSGGTGNCTPGTVGCSCNGTSCDQGLQCANVGGGQTQCVSVGSGSGGTTGTGGDTGTGGSTGTGGTTGTGGNVSTGGTTGTGGSSSGGTTGTGGSSSGGTTGSGGSSSGGATGSGGTGSGTNLIVNGDFSQGMTNWHFENGTANLNGNQYCASTINSGALFGWQNTATPLMLSGSASYTLSYQASGQNNASIHVKVAHAVDTFMPDDYDPSNQNDSFGTSLQTITHTFTPAMGDDSNTGVAFFVESGQNVCIANVSLIQN